MRAKYLAVGLLTLAGLLLTGAAQAGDTVRLSLPGSTDAPTLTLAATPADLDADTELVYYAPRGWYGGYRGYGYGGYYRPLYIGLGGWGYGGYGYGGYGYGLGGYGGGYGGYYSGGYYPASYASYSYVSPSYYSYASPCTCGVSYSIPAQASYQTQSPVIIQQQPTTVTPPTPMPPSTVPQPLPGNSSTFQYDGGPRTLIPMPPALRGTTPAVVPGGQSVPRDGRMVSLTRPAASGSYQYRAYGEKPAEAVRPAPIRRQASDLITASLVGEEDGNGFSGGTMVFTQPRR